MSKFEEAMGKYKKHMTEYGMDAEDSLLHKVTKGLGPSIYRADSGLVSCSDKAELERIHKNFVEKKLGITDADRGMAAIKSVCAKYSARNKHRAVFYYMLTKELGAESIYG